MIKIFASALALFGNLCSSTATAAELPSTFMRPDIGVETTVTVGSEMFVRENGAPSVVLDEGLKIGGMFGGETFAVGQALAVSEIDSGTSVLVACTLNNDSLQGTCLIDKDLDGKFDKHRPVGAVFSRKLKAPVSYHPGPAMAAPNRQGTFRQTLAFLGVNGSTFRLGYREFASDWARPAFSDELTFTLSGKFPETIAYKDVVIDVLGVGNAGLRYVLKKANR
jgi:hypothetical protein